MEKNGNPYFPMLFRLKVWSGDFDSLLNEEQHLGWRGSLFALNKQPFDELGVSPVIGKAVTSDNLQTAVFLLGFGFCCFFLDSIYKDLTYFLGKFWAGIKHSSDVEEPAGPLLLTCTDSLWAGCFSFAIELSTFFSCMFSRK